MKKWPKKVQFSQSKMTQHIFNRDQRLSKAAIFLCIAAVTVASCKKVESDLGVDVLPGGDQLNMLVDTVEVNSYTLLEDSIRTDELSSNLLGSYNEAVFGKTTASIYTEIRLSSFNPTFNSPTIDSVVLSLKISGHYGFENTQTFKVYQITEKIERDSAYFSNTVKTNNGIDLVKAGFGTFKPSVTAKPVIEGDTLDPQIRLRLDEAFGNAIINSGALDSDTSFKNFINGLYITVDNPVQGINEGGVYAIDLEDAQSNITIFYHDATDTTKYELPINDKCARFTHYDHDYSGTEIEQQLADSTLGNQYYYLQAGQSVVANLFFPDIFDVQTDGPVIINRAELVLPVQYYTIDPLAPPTRIIAYGMNDEGEIYNMPDYNFPGTGVFGGNYDDEKKAYVFNIIRYVQDVLRGDVMNNPIRITPMQSSVSVNRVILSGKNSPNRAKPYLKIYYTKF